MFEKHGVQIEIPFTQISGKIEIKFFCDKCAPREKELVISVDHVVKISTIGT